MLQWVRTEDIEEKNGRWEDRHLVVINNIIEAGGWRTWRWWTTTILTQTSELKSMFRQNPDVRRKHWWNTLLLFASYITGVCRQIRPSLVLYSHTLCDVKIYSRARSTAEWSRLKLCLQGHKYSEKKCFMQTRQSEDSNPIRPILKEISFRPRSVVYANSYFEWCPCTQLFQLYLPCRGKIMLTARICPTSMWHFLPLRQAVDFQQAANMVGPKQNWST